MRLSALPIIFALVVLGGIGDVQSGASDKNLDMRAVLNSENLTIVVHAVSVQRMMRVKLTRQLFDPYVEANGADYVLTIQDSGRARQIASLLEQLKLDQSPDDAPEVGVRYRLRFLNDGATVNTLYVSPFGAIVHDGRTFRAREERAWLREVWEFLESDLVNWATDPGTAR